MRAKLLLMNSRSMKKKTSGGAGLLFFVPVECKLLLEALAKTLHHLHEGAEPSSTEMTSTEMKSTAIVGMAMSSVEITMAKMSIVRIRRNAAIRSLRVTGTDAMQGVWR